MAHRKSHTLSKQKRNRSKVNSQSAGLHHSSENSQSAAASAPAATDHVNSPAPKEANTKKFKSSTSRSNRSSSAAEPKEVVTVPPISFGAGPSAALLAPSFTSRALVASGALSYPVIPLSQPGAREAAKQHESQASADSVSAAGMATSSSDKGSLPVEDASTLGGADLAPDVDPRCVETCERISELVNSASGLAAVDLSQLGEVWVPGSALHKIVELLFLEFTGEPAQVMSGETLLTTTEAAEYLGVSRTTIRQYFDDGMLPFTAVGSRRKVSAKHLRLFKESNQMWLPVR